ITETPTIASQSPTQTPTNVVNTSGCGGPLYGNLGYFGPTYPGGGQVTTGAGAMNLTYYGTGATAGGTGANASSAGSVLFVFFVMEEASNTCVTQTFLNGATAIPMQYMAGPVAEYNVSNSGIAQNYYWWVYYIQNPPTNNPQLLIKYYSGGSSPPDNATYTFWADYGNTASTGIPVGVYSLTNTYVGGSLTSAGGGSDAYATGAIGVNPQNASSVILEALPMVGTGWGYTNNTQTPANNTVAFSPITAYTGNMGYNQGATEFSDPLLADPMVGLSGGGNLTMSLGQYCPGSTSPFTLNGTYCYDYQMIEGLLWYIEVLGNGDGSTTETLGACGTPIAGPPPVPTPTITVTPPTPNPSVYQGLPPNMRPYGLEYVPFPTVTTGAYQFCPLYETFSAGSPPCSSPPCGSTWGAPVNTARWHLVLTGLSGTVKIETRIGESADEASLISGVYD
ncbi:MAG: hypothetical protein ACREKE_01225, partial [bacterium]